MINTVSIKNFRCFDSIEVKDLGRLNVVVGDNHSGKTAFLEALVLACGNSPENHMKLRSWRGLLGDRILVDSADVSSGQLWQDLFFEFKTERTILISLVGSKKSTRSLTVAPHVREPGLAVARDAAVATAPIRFTWDAPNSKGWSSIPRLYSDGELKWGTNPPGIIGAMFRASGGSGVVEAANRFSALDVKKQTRPLIELMRAQFPDIQDISIQTSTTTGPMLYATLSSVPVKVPLPLVSHGINRWFSLLLAAASLGGGALFIDEVENGIYHSRLGGLWAGIDEISKATDTQVFASAHSGEALDALLPLAKEFKDDIRLIRLTRDKAGKTQARVVKGSGFAAALSEHVEIR